MLNAQDIEKLVGSHMNAIKKSLLDAGIRGCIELECRGENLELVFSTLYPLRDLQASQTANK